jgi:hypothetical protein
MGFGKEYLDLRQHKKYDGNNFIIKMRILINSHNGDKIKNSTFGIPLCFV